VFLKQAGSKKVIAFLLLLCAAAAGIYFYRGFGREERAEEFTKIAVERGDIRSEVTASGEAELQTVELAFELSGIIEEICVSPGDRVKKGDVIARLNADDYELELARANYKAAAIKLAEAEESYKNQVADAKQKLETAEVSYEPMEQAPELYTKQEIALQKIELEAARQDYEAAVKDNTAVESAKASLEQAEINLKKAEKDLAATVLKSPVDGTVLQVNYEVGKRVSSDTDSIAVISVGDTVSVAASINELDVAGVKKGMKAEVEFEAIPGEKFTGTVTGIKPMPEVDSSGIVTYEADITLDGSDERIKSGMTASVTIILEERKNVLLVPSEAVRRAKGGTVVEKIGENGEITEQRVKTGLNDGSNVEIIEGLEEGDTVVVRQGSAVQPAQESGRGEGPANRFFVPPPAGGGRNRP